VTVQAYDADIVSDAAYVHTDNNYTTAEKSKLAGIEAGATADQTAAQILTAVKTVDGAASGLDADLLDGLHASSFLQGNQTITLSGDATGSGTTSIVVTVADDSHNHIISNVDGLQTALDGKAPTSHTHTAAQITDFDTEVSNNTSVAANTAKISNATHTGEVTGSTALTIASNVVDADNLKVTGNGTTSQYLRSDGDGSFTWATPTDTVTNQTITLSGDATGSGTTSIVVTVADDSHNHIISNVDGLQTALDGKAPTSHTHDYVPERSHTDWNDSTVVNDVIGQIAWQNYGNNHTIFDASKSISPSGTSVNNTNSTNVWSATYPTLMGWNGSSTYGVRVDTARYADSADRAYPKRVDNVDLNFNWSGQGGQPPWLWGGSDGSNMYVYNPSNFSVDYANTAGSVSPPTAGSVGSYALLRAKSSSTITYPNTTVAGSTMSYTDVDWNQYSTPSGTWRCMAYAVTRTRPTLYIRIS